MKKEYIICAAIWYKELDTPMHKPVNIEKGVVLCGYRHPHIIGQVSSLLGAPQSRMGEYIQGFLTNKNRFVDREEAAKIFIENGGILGYSDDKLYSEDLY